MDVDGKDILEYIFSHWYQTGPLIDRIFDCAKAVLYPRVRV